MAETGRRKRKHTVRYLVWTLSLALIFYTGLCYFSPFQMESGIGEHKNENSMDPTFEKELKTFAGEHGLSAEAWPEELLIHADENPHVRKFILEYPLKKETEYEIDLKEYADTETVPLLFQWDERWGYDSYAGDLLGFTGCGPTCLSMVSIYLTHQTENHPGAIAAFSEERGYSVEGSGSSWTLISDGGKILGMEVIEIPLDRDRIFRNLEAHHPIICVMGPGEFTTSGHFVVLAGCEKGKIRINDPNSPERSSQLWEYETIADQIRNLWVCR